MEEAKKDEAVAKYLDREVSFKPYKSMSFLFSSTAPA